MHLYLEIQCFRTLQLNLRPIPHNTLCHRLIIKLLFHVSFLFPISHHRFRLSFIKPHYDVINYPDKPWDWLVLSRKRNTTVKDLLDYPNMPWHWKNVSQNPNITMKFILDNPTKKWIWHWIRSKK